MNPPQFHGPGIFLAGIILGLGAIFSPPPQLRAAGPDVIAYPANRQLTTDLNPIYAPFIHPAWSWHTESSWDRDGGNDDGSAYVTKEGNQWVLLDQTNVSGMVTRIWFAAPVLWSHGPEARIPTLTVITDPQGTTTTLSLAPQASANTPPYLFPFITDRDTSSGGLVSYVPLAFNGRLKILTDSEPRYFQITYTTATTPSGTIDTDGLAPLWTPSQMGQSVDQLSFNTPLYLNPETTPITTTLAPQSRQTLFSRSGAGIVTKITFPAAAITESLSHLVLKITYPDTDTAQVNLPLNYLLAPLNQDFTPALPPFANITANAFTPTGKEIVIQGDQVWIREPLMEDITKVGQNGTWSHLKLATWLQGPGVTPPPTPDTYAITPQGAEVVIKDTQYWYRSSATNNWSTNTLASAWPGSSTNGYPLPHNLIDSQSFDLQGHETITSAGRYWTRVDPSQSWWSDTLFNAWGLPFTQVDGHSFSTLGETFISGSQYWYRRNQSSPWSSNTLVSAWNYPRYYQGSLFFGYDSAKAEYYLTWPIPFWGGIDISLENTSTASLPLTAAITTTHQSYSRNQAGYLHIVSTAAIETPANPLFSAATIQGSGKFVSYILKASGDISPTYGRTFLEGDDQITVDGQVVGHGAGTEDFFNSGWYFLNGPYWLPTHGAPISMFSRLQTPIPDNPYQLGLVNTRHDPTTLMYRHFLNDAIHFNHEFIFQSEFGPTPLNRSNQGQATEFNSVSVFYLSVPPTPPNLLGDIHPPGGDGDVDILDQQTLISLFDTEDCLLNLFGSCFIDIFDFHGLLSHFGQSQPS